MTDRTPAGEQAAASPRLTWAPAALAALCALAGVGVGIAAKAVDGAGIPEWLHALGNGRVFYLLLVIAIGWTAPSVVAAALRGVLFFLGVCAGYYAWSGAVFGFVNESALTAWILLAVILAPAAAALTRWAVTTCGLLPGAWLACLGGAALSDSETRLLWWRVSGQLTEGTPAHTTQAILDLAAVVLIVGLAPRDGRSRVWALVLLVPFAVAIGRLAEFGYGHGLG